VTTDQQNVTNAEQKVTTDNGSISTSRTSLSAAEQSLATAASAAVGYDAGAVFTKLPSAGSVVRRGQRLYTIGAQAVLLLYGSTPAWRPFRAGMSPGKDVAELHANLRALGYGKGLAGDGFSAATERAIRSLQAARGLPRTGDLPLGSVVFKAGAVRVTAVLAKLGAAVQAGPVLSVSTTRHQVAIDLDASHQSDVKVGDRVTITLPDTRTTTGVVSAVGRVAAAGSQGSSPTVSVSVTLTHQAAAGRLDQAPVQVSITTSSVDNALVVPVNALLALAGGGYAVEVVGAGGVHRLVTVDLGLFDDAEGLVQVSGTGVHAGQQIVVPST
jgi:peptidoglycan hydrolase-like protein with peptidoglycan-binding domain